MAVPAVCFEPQRRKVPNVDPELPSDPRLFGVDMVDPFGENPMPFLGLGRRETNAGGGGGNITS